MWQQAETSPAISGQKAQVSRRPIAGRQTWIEHGTRRGGSVGNHVGVVRVGHDLEPDLERAALARYAGELPGSEGEGPPPCLGAPPGPALGACRGRLWVRI